MGNDYILKNDILKMLDLQKCKWVDIKGSDQDVTQKNFIDNVILVLEWIMGDIEKM